MGPRKSAIRLDPDLPIGRGNFEEEGAAYYTSLGNIVHVRQRQISLTTCSRQEDAWLILGNVKNVL